MMEKANKSLRRRYQYSLLHICSSQDDSAKQQCCLYQMFTWPKKLQHAEVAGNAVESGDRGIV